MAGVCLTKAANKEEEEDEEEEMDAVYSLM